MRKLACIGAGIAGLLLAVAAARAADEAEPPLPKVHWSFDGPFGTFDRAAAQRGFQIYEEVCSRCHSLTLLRYGDLGPNGPGGGIGYSADEVKAIASTKQVTDGPNDQGEMFQRPGRPSDKFVAPFPNEQAARAALNGALPPDLSLITKALEGGPNQAFGVLTGYRDPPPAGFKLADGMYYDLYFAGHQIAMPPPLAGNDVTYADGTKPTLEQEAQDVVTFLSWAAEPTMEERKYTGAKVLIFLVFMTGLLFGAKRKIWADVH
jgi:ubiquinol-cytochrome c reductase cytochrome c1 subunit